MSLIDDGSKVLTLSEKMAAMKKRMGSAAKPMQEQVPHTRDPRLPPVSPAVQAIIDAGISKKHSPVEPMVAAPTPAPAPALVPSSLVQQLKERAAAARAGKILPRPASAPASTIATQVAAPTRTEAKNILQQHEEKLASAESNALAAVKAKLAANKAAQAARATATLELPSHLVIKDTPPHPTGTSTNGIPEIVPVPAAGGVIQLDKSQVTKDDLNEDQLQALELARNGIPFCLIGSAGSGKTTTVRMIAQLLYEEGLIGNLGGDGTKWLRADGPSIAIISFTNQAVTNIKSAVPVEFQRNCITAHKLIEFAPEFYDVEDPTTGDSRTTMRYLPTRHYLNPIRGLTHLVIEESGSVGVELYDQVMNAMATHPITIFLGDLNQIPPVFGDAILGFKLLELPIVELKRSYRTDSDSAIRKLAYAILDGRPISDKKLKEMEKPGELEIIRFKDRLSWEAATPQMGRHLAALTKAHFAGNPNGFNYEEDVVLIPYNKQFGSTELGRYIAQAVTEVLGVPTYEIVVGIPKVYYAVGDIVYFNKSKCRITKIQPNPAYGGVTPRQPSLTLNRWGHDSAEEEVSKLHELKQISMAEEDVEALFFALAEKHADDDNEVSFRQASHQISLLPLDDDSALEITVGDVGSINSMYLAYCITVHKSQGSEWNNVFCIFHHSHANMLKREILYTATTRARKKCVIFYSGEDDRAPSVRKNNDSAFQKGIIKQAIPGDTVAEKLKYFRGKLRAEAMKNEIERAKSEGRAPNVANLKDDATIAKQLLNKLSNNSIGNNLSAPTGDTITKEMQRQIADLADNF